jgi:hypothetical protein
MRRAWKVTRNKRTGAWVTIDSADDENTVAGELGARCATCDREVALSTADGRRFAVLLGELCCADCYATKRREDPTMPAIG